MSAAGPGAGYCSEIAIKCASQTVLENIHISLKISIDFVAQEP
jgi:hypothetical protein